MLDDKARMWDKRNGMWDINGSSRAKKAMACGRRCVEMCGMSRPQNGKMAIFDEKWGKNGQ
jgi:hypothetical protein